MTQKILRDFSGGQVDDRHPAVLAENQFARIRDFQIHRGTLRKRDGFDWHAGVRSIGHPSVSNWTPNEIRKVDPTTCGIRIPRGTGASSTRWNLGANFTIDLHLNVEYKGNFWIGTTPHVFIIPDVSGGPGPALLVQLMLVDATARTYRIRVRLRGVTTGAVLIDFVTVLSSSISYNISIARVGTDLKLYVDNPLAAAETILTGLGASEVLETKTADIYFFQTDRGPTDSITTTEWGAIGNFRLWNTDVTADNDWIRFFGMELDDVAASKTSLVAYHPMKEGANRVIASGISANHPSFSAYSIRGLLFGKPGFDDTAFPSGSTRAMISTGYGGIRIPPDDETVEWASGAADRYDKFVQAMILSQHIAGKGWTWVLDFKPDPVKTDDQDQILFCWGDFTSSKQWVIGYNHSQQKFWAVIAPGDVTVASGTNPFRPTTQQVTGTKYQVALRMTAGSPNDTYDLLVNQAVLATMTTGTTVLEVITAVGKFRNICCAPPGQYDTSTNALAQQRRGAVGTIANLTIWSRPLAATELRRIYNRVLQGSNVADSDLLDYYPLTDESASFVHAPVPDQGQLQLPGYVDLVQGQRATDTSASVYGDPGSWAVSKVKALSLGGCSPVLEYTPPGQELADPIALAIAGGGVLQLSSSTANDHRWMGEIVGAYSDKNHRGGIATMLSKIFVATRYGIGYEAGTNPITEFGGNTDRILPKPKIVVSVATTAGSAYPSGDATATGQWTTHFRYSHFDDEAQFETPLSELFRLQWTRVSASGYDFSVTVPIPFRKRVSRARLYRTLSVGPTGTVVEQYYRSSEVHIQDLLSNNVILDSKTEAQLLLQPIADMDRFEVRAANSCTVHQDRLALVGLAGAESTFILSDPGEPEVFRPSSFRAVPSRTGGRIVASRSFQGRHILFKTDSLWEQIGDPPASDALIVVSNDIGCDAPDSIVERDGSLWWIWRDGVYVYDGQVARKVSSELDGTFRGLTYQGPYTPSVPALAIGNLKDAVAVSDTASNRLIFWVAGANAYIQGLSPSSSDVSNTKLSLAAVLQEVAIPDRSEKRLAWTILSLPALSVSTTRLAASNSSTQANRQHRVTIVDPYGGIWLEAYEQFYDAWSDGGAVDRTALVSTGTIGVSTDGRYIDLPSLDPFAFSGDSLRGTRLILIANDNTKFYSRVVGHYNDTSGMTRGLIVSPAISGHGGKTFGTVILGAIPASLRTGVIARTEDEDLFARKFLNQLRLFLKRAENPSSLIATIAVDEEPVLSATKTHASIGPSASRFEPATIGLLPQLRGYSFQIQLDTDEEPDREFDILGIGLLLEKS